MITFTRDWRGYAKGSSVGTLAATMEALSVAEGAAVYGGVAGPLNSYLGRTNAFQPLVDEGGKNIPIDNGRYPSSNAQVRSPSKPLFNFGSQANTLGLTNCTEAFNTAYTGFHTYTREISITDPSNSSIAKGTQSLQLDTTDQLLQLDLYLPFAPITGQYITITLNNASTFTGNNVAMSFDSGYLKQGWNSLRMWGGDAAGAAGVGTLAAGMSKTINGTGFDWTLPIGRFDINFVAITARRCISMASGAAARVRLVW